MRLQHASVVGHVELVDVERARVGIIRIARATLAHVDGTLSQVDAASARLLCGKQRRELEDGRDGLSECTRLRLRHVSRDGHKELRALEPFSGERVDVRGGDGLKRRELIVHRP